jgi:hypothetical protein
VRIFRELVRWPEVDRLPKSMRRGAIRDWRSHYRRDYKVIGWHVVFALLCNALIWVGWIPLMRMGVLIVLAIKFQEPLPLPLLWDELTSMLLGVCVVGALMLVLLPARNRVLRRHFRAYLA